MYKPGVKLLSTDVKKPMYKPGVRILCTIDKVEDDPKNTDTVYHISCGNANGKISGSVLQVINEKWFEEYMNPPVEKKMNIQVYLKGNVIAAYNDIDHVNIDNHFLTITKSNGEIIAYNLSAVESYMVKEEA